MKITQVDPDIGRLERKYVKKVFFVIPSVNIFRVKKNRKGI